jgi:hypothetical protein
MDKGSPASVLVPRTRTAILIIFLNTILVVLSFLLALLVLPLPLPLLRSLPPLLLSTLIALRLAIQHVGRLLRLALPLLVVPLPFLVVPISALEVLLPVSFEVIVLPPIVLLALWG